MRKCLHVEVRIVNQSDWNDVKRTNFSVEFPEYYMGGDISDIFYAIARNISEEAFVLPSEVKQDETEEKDEQE